jgi:predicted nuclease of restriction endonuclease-like (RecB) superfamily
VSEKRVSHPPAYDGVLSGMVELLEQARRASARVVNSIMTATYWELGRRIVELEQGGSVRAGYGETLLERLAADLTARFGRGFSRHNLARFRDFYLAFPPDDIRATVSLGMVTDALPGDAIRATPSLELRARKRALGRNASATDIPIPLAELARLFPLPWSHYILLVRRVRASEARSFYDTEARRNGWTVRQLERQIETQFYERTALSRNKAAMLRKGAKPKPEDAVTPDEEIRDPLVLEFLDLKDEYSETDLESALVRHLESFLLELGGDFCFVARQRRLRIDDEWFRVDLVFYHRVLRCLVLIDLKLGRFTHADAGQMHVYLNYAGKNWTRSGENPPVGLILCASKGAALARYATENLPTKMLVREYLTALPKASVLEAEIEKTRRQLQARKGPAQA